MVSRIGRGLLCVVRVISLREPLSRAGLSRFRLGRRRHDEGAVRVRLLDLEVAHRAGARDHSSSSSSGVRRRRADSAKEELRPVCPDRSDRLLGLAYLLLTFSGVPDASIDQHRHRPVRASHLRPGAGYAHLVRA
jgi:hypothetical protein